jgi:hypothetical protein
MRPHYSGSELEDFLGKINQYGLGRRLFGTDHSLGLGPLELEEWDEVWMLEGSKVPFLLRPVGHDYKLVGACYVHAYDRSVDHCFVCSGETIRESITTRSRLVRDPAVQRGLVTADEFYVSNCLPLCNKRQEITIR